MTLKSRTKRFLAALRAESQGSAWTGIAVLIILLLLVALGLVGCAGAMDIVAVEPTATVYAPPSTDIPAPPPGPTPEALDFPLAAPTRVVVEPVDDQACVDCHTSEETLKEVAEVEEESSESLSEGEG